MRIPFILSVCLLACACRYLPLDKPTSHQIAPVPSTLKPTVTPAQPLGAGEIYAGQTRLHSNGRMYDLRSGKMVTGKLVDFHPNSQKRFEKSMINGLSDGNATWWDDAGRTTHQRTYQAGLLHGSWTEYYSSTGRKRQEQVYQDGVETMRRGWWPNGMKRFEVELLEGVEKSRALFDQEGKPIGKSAPPTPTEEEEPPQPKPILQAPSTLPSVASHKALATLAVDQLERDRIIQRRQEYRQRRIAPRQVAGLRQFAQFEFDTILGAIPQENALHVAAAALRKMR